VADPKEAWMMSVVNGKHWVARRLGDNEVAVIPNYYTIKEVNLKDTMNYLGSADLITYAKNRGWYHPDINGKFNFREVYGDPSNLQHLENIGRKWAAVNLLAKEKVEMGNNFAWSFVPKKKLSPADLMKVLSNHYEGTDLDDTENYKLRNPHELKPHGVCASHNQYGFVAQLRSFMPAPIGNVMWLAPRRPCINAFTPWYIGITYIPEGYASRSFEEALNNHFEAPEKPCADGGNYIYCDYASFCEQMDKQYDRHIVSVRAKVEAFQKSLFEQQKAFEEKAMAVWKKDPQRAAIMLTRYTHQQSSSGVRLNAGIFEDGNQ
jgi:dipeptidase